MKILVYMLVGALCVSLLTPTEGAFIRSVGRWFRKAGETVVKVVKDNAKAICKVGITDLFSRAEVCTED